MRVSRIVLAMSLCAYAACAAAAIYKWVDRDGVTHYSETPPPPEVQTRVVPIQAAPTAPAPAPKTASEGDKDAPAAPAAPSTGSDKEKLAKSRAVQCSQVKDTLKTLDSPLPVYTSNSAGDQVLLTNQEREEAVERWKKLEDKYCAPQE
jgi:hypothetical protein